MSQGTGPTRVSPGSTDPDVPAHLLAYIAAHGLDAEILAPGLPMPTVPLAAAAIGVPEAHILKSLLFVAADGRLVLAVAAGVSRVDRAILGAVAGLPGLRLAGPDLVRSATGYPAGGVAPIAHATPLPVVVDTAAAALPVTYGGAGTEDALLRIRPADIVRLTDAVVASITTRP